MIEYFKQIIVNWTSERSEKLALLIRTRLN